MVIASMNAFSGAVNAWWSIVFYSADDAPNFTKGMWAMIGCSIALVIWSTGLLYMTAREDKKRVSPGVAADEEASLEEAMTKAKAG